MIIPQLIQRPPFVLDECLLSWLSRLMGANYCNSVSLMKNLLSQSHQNLNWLERPNTLLIYQQLAQLTGAGIEELYQLTPHRFAKVLIQPDTLYSLLELTPDLTVPLLTSSLLHGHVYTNYDVQYCPCCLIEDNGTTYYRLGWLPRAIAVCPTHNCFLVRGCPGCQHLARLGDLVSDHCSFCKARFSQAIIKPVGLDQFTDFTQNLVKNWFLEELPLATVSDYRLPVQPPNILFRILTGLRSILITKLRTSNWPYVEFFELDNTPQFILMHQTSKTTCYGYAAALKALCNWPHNFYQFLDTCRAQDNRARLANRRGETEFGSIYTNWIKQKWNHPDFAFVQTAVDQYVLEKCKASQWVMASRRYHKHIKNNQNFELIGITEAGEILGVTAKRVKELIKAGKLSGYDSEKDGGRHYKHYKLTNRAEVIALHQKWGDHPKPSSVAMYLGVVRTQTRKNSEILTLSEAANFLGIGKSRVGELVKVGLLPFNQKAGALDKGRLLVSKTILEQCLANICQNVQLYAEEIKNGKIISDREVLDLSQAAHIAYTVGLNAAAVLNQVAQGCLPCYRRDDQPLRLNSLIFKRSEVQRWADNLKNRYNWIGQDEVRTLLAVKDTTYKHWLKIGLIKPVAMYGQIRYFDRTSIQDFKRTYISAKEAAPLVKLTENGLRNWLHKGLLEGLFITKLSPEGLWFALYHRDNLTAWRQARMKTSEAALQLNMSDAYFLSLAKLRNIKPIAEMGCSPYWFWKQNVLSLQHTNI